MSAMHIDITADNSNIVTVVNDTVAKFKGLSDTLKGFGSTDLDALKEAIQENSEYVDTLQQKLQGLGEELEEAARAGDTEKVERLSVEMKELATDIQAVVNETREYTTAFAQLAPVEAEVQGMTKALGDMAVKVQEVAAEKGIDFSNSYQGASELKLALTEVMAKVNDYKAQLDSLYEKQIEAAKTGDVEGLKSFSDEIVRVKTEMDESMGVAQKYSEVLSFVSQGVDTSKFQGDAAAMAAFQQSIQAAQMELVALQQANSDLDLSNTTNQMVAITSEMEKNRATINDYKSQLEELKREQEQALGSGDFATADELGQKILALSGNIQQLNEQQQALGSTLELVKNGFKQQGDEAERNNTIITRLFGSQQNYNEIINTLPAGLRNVISGIQGTTKAAMKFIATPIGAVIGALVLAYKALSTWLTKSAEGQQKLATITGYFKGIVAALENVVKKVGKSLYDAFKNPKDAVRDFVDFLKSQVTNRIEALGQIFVNLGDIIKNVFKGNFDEVKEAASELGKNVIKMGTGIEAEDIKSALDGINDIAKAESALEERRNKLHRERSAWEVKEAELDERIQEARNKMYTGTPEERLKAAAEAEALINQKYAQRIKFAQEEYNIKKESNALTDSSQEDLDEENHLLAEITAQRRAQKGELMMFQRRGNTAENADIQAQMRAENELTALIFQNREKRLSMIEDEDEKEVEAIKLKYDKALDAIARKRREFEEENRRNFGTTTLTQEQENALSEAEQIADEEFISDNTKHLSQLVEQYKSYETQRAEITAKGIKDVNLLREAGYKEEADLAEKAYKSRLAILDKQNKDLYKRLAQDSSKLGAVAISKLLLEARQEISQLSKTPEDAKENAELIQYLEHAIDNLQKTVNDFSVPTILRRLLNPDDNDDGVTDTLKERWDAIRADWSEMSSQNRWKAVSGWVNTISSGLGKAAEYMRKIADLTGNSRLEVWSDVMDGIAQNLNAAASWGQATQSWVGAIVGGVVDMGIQIGNTIIKNKAEQKKYNLALEQTLDMMRSIRNEQTLTEGVDSIFGTNSIKAIENASKAIKDVRADMDKTLSRGRGLLRNNIAGERGGKELLRQLEGYTNEEIETEFGKMIVTKRDDTWFNKYEKAAKKEEIQLSSALDKWGTRSYDSIGNIAAKNGWKLLDENGNYVIETLEAIKKAYPFLKQEEVDWINAAIADTENYNKALKQITDALNNVFNNTASQLADATIEGLTSGATVGAERLKSIVSGSIKDIQKRMVENIYLKYLDTYSDKIVNMVMEGGSEKDIINELAKMTSGLGPVVEMATRAAGDLQDYAERLGFNLNQLGDADTSSSWKTISQETGSELNGRFAALQISGEAISQAAQMGLVQLINIGNLVSAGGSALEDIKDMHELEVIYLQDIAKQTKPLLEFGDILSKIQENTSRI